jgi:peptidoglycan LD-endopeptidase CwlK
MFHYSKISQKRLESCHPDLQRLFNEVIKEHDCAIICGHRDEIAQNEAYRGGFSKARWPYSKHNSLPSMAVDAAPFPIDWSDHKRFCDFASDVMETAKRLGIKIKWGGHFASLKDFPHFEIEGA